MDEYWIIECNECGEPFISRTKLNKHLWDKHGINVNFKTGGIVKGNILSSKKTQPEIIVPSKSELIKRKINKWIGKF